MGQTALAFGLIFRLGRSSGAQVKIGKGLARRANLREARPAEQDANEGEGRQKC